MAKSNVSLYRAMHQLRKGGLHKALGVSDSEDIADDKLEAAKSGDNDHVKEMAKFHQLLKAKK